MLTAGLRQCYWLLLDSGGEVTMGPAVKVDTRTDGEGLSNVK